MPAASDPKLVKVEVQESILLPRLAGSHETPQAEPGDKVELPEPVAEDLIERGLVKKAK